MKVAALPTLSTCFRPKIPLSTYRKHQLHHGCSLPSKSARRQHFIGCSIKTRAAEHFGESNNLSTYLKASADGIWDASAKQIKKFPWKKASSIVAERLLILGQKGLKWSLVLLFAVSFLSDVIMAVSRNRELMIPLGLFIGVVLANFLRESSQEFFQRTIKPSKGFSPFTCNECCIFLCSELDNTENSCMLLFAVAQEERVPVQLLGAGSLFVLIKFLSLCFNVQWRMLLSHIGNGGLMQVLWLAKEMQPTVNGHVHEDEVPCSEN